MQLDFCCLLLLLTVSYLCINQELHIQLIFLLGNQTGFHAVLFFIKLYSLLCIGFSKTLLIIGKMNIGR